MRCRDEGRSTWPRRARPDSTIAFYVWDYPGGGVGFIDAFWKAAIELHSDASTLDEAVRFPFCTADRLAEEVAAAGCSDVTVEGIEVPTTFVDFDAFWQPFTLGAGPAPGYVDSLTPGGRGELKQLLADGLGVGPIELSARAWAVTARPGRP